MANDIKYKMSQARLDELSDELNHLEIVRAREIAEQIKEARSYGDLSENSEYDEAMTEQGKIFSRIAELRGLIERSEIVERVEATGIVAYGTNVTIISGDGLEQTYKIVGSQEANPMQGMMSDDSPIGLALIGRAVGDAVDVEVPAGTLHFTIKEIEN